MASTKTICDICAEKTTKVARRLVECPDPKCEFSCCIQCIKNYLITDESVDHQGVWEPRCMSCKSPYNLMFILDNFPKKFHNNVMRLKKAKIDLALARQQISDPSIQRRAKMEKNALLNVPIIVAEKEKIQSLKRRITKHEHYIHYLSAKGNAAAYDGKVDIWRQLEAQRDGPREKKKRKERIVFACECPKSSCRGVMNEKYKCTQCDIYLCRKCEKEKHGDDHECQDDDVQAVLFKKRTCKACPGCKVPTFRPSGCNQMWCRQCKVFWNWQTQTVLRAGPRHNPEYLRYLQAHPDIDADPHRVVGGQNGGGECRRVSYRELRRLNIPEEDTFYFRYVVRLNSHITEVVIPARQRLLNRNNDDLAIKYVIGKIDEKRWTAALKKRRKEMDKIQEELQVFNYYVLVSETLLSNVVSDSQGHRKYKAGLENLTTDFNQRMMNLARAMNILTYQLESSEKVPIDIVRMRRKVKAK